MIIEWAWKRLFCVDSLKDYERINADKCYEKIS